ncbi:hypothetical protein BDZ89DRAFT_1084700, partial [Hymenopellis radicata]
MPAKTPPPFTLPTFIDSDEGPTGNGIMVDQVGVSAGMQLIVWGLDRSSQRSALENFTTTYPAILNTAANLQSPPFMPDWVDLRVVAGETTRCVDYIFVSLQETFSQEPRPDILAQLKDVINMHPILSADWNVTSRADKTRRVYFLPGSHGTEVVKARIEAALAHRNVDYQHLFIMKTSSGERIVVDLLHRDHVRELLDKPLIINQTTYHAHQPRFIIPKFGYDIAITGCGGIGRFKAGMDAIIRRRFNGEDIIAHSRMELDGDTYVVVMRSSELATTLVATDLPHPLGVPSNITLSSPLYLWFFNAQSCPAQSRFLEPSTTTMAGDGAVQPQLDSMREHINLAASTFNVVLRAQNQHISEIRNANNTLQNAMALTSAITDARFRLMSVQNEIGRLEADKSTKHTLLLLAEDKPGLVATYSAALEDIQGRLLHANREQTQANDDLQQLLALNKARLLSHPPPEQPPQEIGQHDDGPPTNRQRMDDQMNE